MVVVAVGSQDCSSCKTSIPATWNDPTHVCRTYVYGACLNQSKNTNRPKGQKYILYITIYTYLDVLTYCSATSRLFYQLYPIVQYVMFFSSLWFQHVSTKWKNIYKFKTNQKWIIYPSRVEHIFDLIETAESFAVFDHVFTLFYLQGWKHQLLGCTSENPTWTLNMDCFRGKKTILKSMLGVCWVCIC